MSRCDPPHNEMATTVKPLIDARCADGEPTKPRAWSASSQRKMARLYVYTTLPVEKILRLLGTNTETEGEEKTTPQSKMEGFLDKRPRWLVPRHETNAQSIAERGSAHEKSINSGGKPISNSTQERTQYPAASASQSTGRRRELVKGCLEYTAAGACALVLNNFEAHRASEDRAWEMNRPRERPPMQSWLNETDTTAVTPASFTTVMAAIAIYSACLGRRYYRQKDHPHQDIVLCFWILVGTAFGLLCRFDMEQILLGVLPGFALAAPLSLTLFF